MPYGIARIPLSVLQHALGLTGKADILQVFPPTVFDLEKQRVSLMLESPSFAPNHPSIPIPEVHLVHEVRHDNLHFVEFEFPREPRENPDPVNPVNPDDYDLEEGAL